LQGLFNQIYSFQDGVFASICPNMSCVEDVRESRKLSLQVISLPPAEPADWVMILLHGWGGNAADLASLTQVMPRSNYWFICPQAPHPHPHVPDGWMWYELQPLSGIQDQPTGLLESRQLLRDWLLALPQTTGLPLERTILSGFSQGGAMTLDLGLSLPFAALMIYSGFLHSNPQQASDKPPVFMAHGTQDPVVPLAAAQMAHRQLTHAGLAVTYREYAMGHEITPEVIKDSQTFLANLKS
jgi:phospholipase/carboxylesterase